MLLDLTHQHPVRACPELRFLGDREGTPLPWVIYVALLAECCSVGCTEGCNLW